MLNFVRWKATREKMDDWADRWSWLPYHGPQQVGGNDCGVFMCMGALCLAKGLDFDFGMDDVVRMRAFIMLETMATANGVE